MKEANLHAVQLSEADLSANLRKRDSLMQT